MYTEWTEWTADLEESVVCLKMSQIIDFFFLFTCFDQVLHVSFLDRSWVYWLVHAKNMSLVQLDSCKTYRNPSCLWPAAVNGPIVWQYWQLWVCFSFDVATVLLKQHGIALRSKSTCPFQTLSVEDLQMVLCTAMYFLQHVEMSLKEIQNIKHANH